jgi:CHC2 zinc finger
VFQAPNPKANGNTPVDHVLSHLQGVRRSGAGWMAKCPHHDDRQPSLSIKEADDGKVLLHCHRGCGTADIVMSVGLSFGDLFPPGSRERRQPRVWLGNIPMGPNGRPALESMGDDRVAAWLGEIARLASARGTLDEKIVASIRIVAGAVGVSRERLAEAARAAIATDEPA